ncbi:UDP-galactopyranose mutase [uncultured Mailhella sp.]|uniref:UDP-galactopyranose mutase n=1 Tax=uncultured Mailhella sp. TaxID=1981031 RepID=UPI002617FE33|nr:UDP-galactopyranose mutase [uncultured Mailhella sp.]
MKNIVVGAGISGAAAARVLAERGEKVLVIDKRPHIGGTCYDYYHGSGICIHQYGPHIFHTNDKSVWDFLSRFTDWIPYMHKVAGLVDGTLVPIPFNLNSLCKVFPHSLAKCLEEKLLSRFGFNKRIPILELQNNKDKDLAFLAAYIYIKVFLPYTMKQWGIRPDELDPSVTARVPVCLNRDDRYFQERWQGIPARGYTAMMERMLRHKNITVQTDTAWSDVKDEFRGSRVLYTGSVDEFMDYQFGELPYRSVRLEFREYAREFFQTHAVINYPENYDFTRITEYKHFLGDRASGTVVSFEYPEAYRPGENLPFYPIPGQKNSRLYERYCSSVKKDHADVIFFGRLGDYKYYNMDAAVARALAVTRVC